MASGIFYRNIRARDQLELFLLSAVTSLLLVRFYLFAAGYPQLGGDGLHIAHMLWGGILMMAALAITLSYLGARARRVAAVVGGIGFGVFIDELGKFITHDNNYFYQPAIGLIYAIFIAIYLAFNFLGRTRPLSSREYQLNALAQLEEAAVHNMDPAEKHRVEELLALADPEDPVTKSLQKVMHALPTIPAPQPSRLQRWWHTVRTAYRHHWKKRNSSLAVRIFFLSEVFIFVVGGFLSAFNNIGSVVGLLDEGTPFETKAVIGQLVASLVAAGFAIWGAILWPRSRMAGYEQFRRATLVNVFLTQFFIFARLEFIALPGFFFNLALLGFINYAMRQHSEPVQKEHEIK